MVLSFIHSYFLAWLRGYELRWISLQERVHLKNLLCDPVWILIFCVVSSLLVEILESNTVWYASYFFNYFLYFVMNFWHICCVLPSIIIFNMVLAELPITFYLLSSMILLFNIQHFLLLYLTPRQLKNHRSFLPVYILCHQSVMMSSAEC